MTPDAFRRYGHELIELIAAYRERSARGELPVLARTRPGELRSALPADPPEQGEPMSDILADLSNRILPG